MSLITITSGQTFFDIDTWACATAYKELLEKTGQTAQVFLPGVANVSVSPMVKALGWDYLTECPPETKEFVIVDVSNPKKFATGVEVEKVKEIFDHHPGWEKFWQDKLGAAARIEMIGACATLIWEAYVRAGKEKEISPFSASLLSLAIVSNTLDFNLPITSLRDHEAFDQLSKFHQLPEGWKEKYFQEQEDEIFLDLPTAFLNDVKIEEIPILDEPLVIGQLELRDPRRLLTEKRNELEKIVAAFNHKYWLINLPSLVEKKSYWLANNPVVQKVLSERLGVVFDNGLAKTEKLMLRKMFLEKLLK
ncbi:MAG: hypothetical protein V1664_03745 [Candidatus Uhrbacteria bacterium]